MQLIPNWRSALNKDFVNLDKLGQLVTRFSQTFATIFAENFEQNCNCKIAHRIRQYDVRNKTYAPLEAIDGGARQMATGLLVEL